MVYGEFIARHPKFVVSMVILSIIVSGYYASNIRIGVDTGRFELKNNAYKTYTKIVDTFGNEKDDVIIVAVSRDGYWLNKEDLLEILNVETHINDSANISSLQSPVDYIAMGMELLDFQDSLSPNLNITLSPEIFDMVSKLVDAISEYEYMNESTNTTIKNDGYNIFVLLPSYTSKNMSFSMGIENFTYPWILNNSKYVETRMNSTNILLDQIEIYENLTEYGFNENISNFTQIPENYSLEFVNDTISSLDFNITRCKIGMESYNTTFFEWYFYNVSFETALSLVYSGYTDIAKNLYKFSRGAMLNNSQNYKESYREWENYSHNLTKFENGEKDLNSIINETEERKNQSMGTLRDYLTNYLSELNEYKNSNITWGEIVNYTDKTINITYLIMNRDLYGFTMDDNALPLLNKAIENVDNTTNYSISLISLSEKNMKEITEKIGYFYGLKFIFSKLRDIMYNLKSILIRDETEEIKKDAWELISAPVNYSEDNFNTKPLYRALNSYRDTLNTEYWVNSTNILWDYFTIPNSNLNTFFDFGNYTDLNVSYENYTRGEMIDEVKNKTQDDINDYFARIESYDNGTIENIIGNYTGTINKTILNLTELENTLEYVDKKYNTITNLAGNLSVLICNVTEEISNATEILNDYGDSVYSMRGIEDYFYDGKIYLKTLISRDGASSLLIVELEDAQDEWNVKDAVDEGEGKHVNFHVLGSNILVRKIEDTAKHDMFTFLPVSLIFLVVILSLIYGNIKNTLLSLSAVLIVLIWLFSFTALLGWNFDPILLAVPIMLVGIGIDDGIYVTLRYMEERTVRNRKRAAIITISTVGGALILTTVTSIAGFMSNTISNMEDIRRFGILASMGLLFSFIAMNTYLPAVNMLLDSRKNKRKKVEIKGGEIGAVLAEKNPYIVISVAVLLSIAGIISLEHISTEFNIKDMAPQHSEIIQYYHFYERNFNASTEISYIYMKGNLTSPQMLKAMAETQKNIENDITVVHEYPVLSPWGIMEKYAHARKGEVYYNEKFIKLFDESDVDGDGIPDRNITKLYNMLHPAIDPVLRENEGIFVIHTDSHNLKRVDLLVKELQDDSAPLKKYGHVEISGDAITGKSSIDEINENQIRSLFIAIVFAIIVLIFLFRFIKGSFTLGIIAAIPIMLVVTWNWLLMYFLNISLNVMTNTIASLCVGLGVDYGIHITHRFVEESSKYYSISQALHRATGRIGKGLIGSATTTIAAIGILSLSTIPPLSNFALILSFSIFFAFLSSLIVLPSLLKIWADYRRRKGHDRVERKVKMALEEGDIETLCKYHVSVDYCVSYLQELIKKGKISMARKVVEFLKEEGYNYTYLLKGGEKNNMKYE